MKDKYIYAVKHSGKIWPHIYTTVDEAKTEVYDCKMAGFDDAEYLMVSIVPVLTNQGEQ